MSAERQEHSAALFSELRTVVRQIHETEGEAAAGLAETYLQWESLPSLVGSLHRLRHQLATCADLYQRATDLVDRQEALWRPSNS
jgi:hypothetical protein